MSALNRDSKNKGKPLNVLILEDREEDAELMLHELRVTGFDPAWQRVETEGDFRQHLDPSLDIIIADYNLPQFTGLQAIDILTETDLGIPFIVVTGAIEETALECLKRGAVDYLLKDRLGRLGPAVIKALEERRIREDNKLALEALRASEQRYRGVADTAVTGLTIVDPDEVITYTNPAFAEMLGYTSIELLGMSLSQLFEPEEFTTIRTQTDYRKQGKSTQYETIVKRKDGESRTIIVSSSPLTSKDGKYEGAQAVITDITDQVQAKKALGESEENLRLMVDNSPIGFCSTNLKGNLIDVNPAMCLLVGYSQKELTAKHFNQISHPDDRENNQEMYQKLVEGKIEYFDLEKRYLHKTGKIVHALIRSQLARNYDGEPLFEFAIVEDITARVKAERLLKALNQAALSVAQALTPDEIFTATGKTFKDLDYDFIILTMDESRTRLHTQYSSYGGKVLRTAENLVGLKQKNFSFPIEKVDVYSDVILQRKTVYIENSEELMQQVVPDTLKRFVGQLVRMLQISKAIAAPLIVNDEVTGILSVQSDDLIESDGLSIATFAHQVAAAWRKAQLYEQAQQEIAERMQAEETLKRYTGQLETINAVTSALSKSLKLDHVLELILDQIGQVLPFDSGAIFLHEGDGLRVVADSDLTQSLKEAVFPADGKLFSEIQQTKKPLILDNAKDDPRFQNWGRAENIASWMGVPLIVRDTLIGFLTLDSIQLDAFSAEHADLAQTFASQAAQTIENARLFQETNQRLKQMAALRKIDQAITSSFDLEVTLNIILDNLLAQLEVDAAAVLRYQADLQTLKFAHGRGFNTDALQHTDLRLGEGCAGEVGLQREPVFIPDLNQDEGKLQECPRFREEGFVAYYGIPLIAKGKLVGVLETFQRSPLSPGDDWVNYLQMLANQTAIAIDNITLFNDLQRSNVDLTLAYDATIEGWAHALELKDMETEGHSRRVVELTMNLARRMGIGGKKLLHVRRGALLHDIGKMGIPDSILQKPGKLTDEEWQIMRQHPVYAYEWLSAIQYLKPALEIPYAHHERWDGTGYPRGLEGEHIPLSARIFAIVDVWDALRSDRPYRKAWSRDKTLDHIKEGSGKHFDPQVVDAFVEMIKTKK